MKKATRILQVIGNWVLFLLSGKGPIANEAIDAGLIDYSGQGRDNYGR